MSNEPASPPLRGGTVVTTPRRGDEPSAAHHAGRRRYRNSGWGPFSTRTWREYGYLWVTLVLAPFALATSIIAVAFSFGLGITVVGLFAAGSVVLLGRAWGRLYRGLARGMLDVDIPAPLKLPPTRGHGFWRALWSWLGDSAGWRALAYCFVSFVLVVSSFVLSTTFLATALGSITYRLWYFYLPWQTDDHGIRHQGAQLTPHVFIDTPDRILTLAAVGVLLLLVWPYLTRGLVHLCRLLALALLGPTPGSLRMAELEVSRGQTVQDADTRLRAIERDLHDGTQARLVAVGMQLGEAVADLEAEVPHPESANALVRSARDAIRETLVELRELARGIRPPALDAGLVVALETLTARSALPCTLDVDGFQEPSRPAAQGTAAAPPPVSPAIEAIAYFCVAELLSNAAKHSGATEVAVDLTRQPGRSGAPALHLRVRDDGTGGARVVGSADGRRTGLAGLTARVASVDGSFAIDSPPGGPTAVTVVLPVTVPASAVG